MIDSFIISIRYQIDSFSDNRIAIEAGVMIISLLQMQSILCQNALEVILDPNTGNLLMMLKAKSFKHKIRNFVH